MIWMKMPPVLVGHCHNQSFGSFSMPFVMLCQASHLFILIPFHCIRYKCLLVCSCHIEHLCVFTSIFCLIFHILVLCLIPPFLPLTGALNTFSLEICLLLRSMTHQNCEVFICFCVFSFEDINVASPSKMSMNLAEMSMTDTTMSMSPEKSSPLRNQ